MYVGPGQVDLCVGGQERADLCVWERDKQICAHGGESRVDLCVGGGARRADLCVWGQSGSLAWEAEEERSRLLLPPSCGANRSVISVHNV
jgi:hypothetical protein